MKVLVVEDEPKTAAYLRTGLSENGFIVDVAEHGDDGLHLALNHEYDVMILDVMLPRRDGWAVLADMRAAGRLTPVLFLTARDAVSDRVKGLELGSDDYLVKPFAFSELLARVRSLVRRGPARLERHLLHVEDLEIDIFRHQASRAGQPIDLTPKEFALLSLLAGRRGEVLSRTVIAEQVWDMNFDPESNVVDVHVKRLRAKLDDPFHRKLIRTVRGVGYVLD
jgi:two-component system copper resistance phosphate regulon response regulator CusR